MYYQRFFMTKNEAAKKEKKKIYIYLFCFLFSPKSPKGSTLKAIVKAKIFVSSFTLMLLMASGEGLERTNRSALRCKKSRFFGRSPIRKANRVQPKYIFFSKKSQHQKIKRQIRLKTPSLRQTKQ